MRTLILILSLTSWVNPAAFSQSATEAHGLIIPRDNDGMYVRNKEGQVEVNWTSKTKVALVVGTRLLSGLKGDRLAYKIHSSKEVVTFLVPKGPVAGIKDTPGGKQLERTLKEAREEKWLSERGLKLYFNQKPAKEQLGAKNDPRFIGTWDPSTKPRTLSINGTKYEISMKKGGQSKALLYNLLTVKDCKPFINKATALGRRKGDVFIADEIHVQPIGDQAALDDPKFPRYLFIGDSISGNYDKGLRESLAGKFNLHHPPTNCGPSGKGAKSIANWLGAYDQPGRHWDVISFNHGHWDSKNDKASYQANLEKVIAELKKTKAKLIWVTTCPVPNGFDKAGSLDANGKATGRTAGVMQKYLNLWAAEVMARHPDITICDQWQFVKANAGGLYTDWWAGKNVHFGGEPADALGKFLGEHVAKVFDVDLKIKPGGHHLKRERRTESANGTQLGSASTVNIIKFDGIPMLKKGFVYQSKKAYGLYDEADTAAALPDAWKEVKPLDSFAGVSITLTPAFQIPDGAGGTFDISAKPSKAVLTELKKKYRQGYGLGWYFFPKEPRYRIGLGLTGDELLSDLRRGKFPEDAMHPSFTYGFYTKNVSNYYRLYRISKDPYYVEQIVKYAEGIEWILANRPQQLIPLEQRMPLKDPVATIPHEPIALANFWAHANAARLLLERARSQSLKAHDSTVVKAKSFLETTVKYIASQVTGDFQPYARKRGEKPTTFVPGEKTLAIQKKYSIPNRAAQVIEYTPWNQSFFYFSTLAATTLALEDLQTIEGGTKYQSLIYNYRNIVRAGIWNFQDENICVVRKGIPYFFHMHTPLRDGKSQMRLGFPMFGAEDASHSGSGALNLPYLWDCGEDFGVTPALMAGYTNAMILTLEDLSSINKNGKSWPRQHIDSPWYLAASARQNHPFKGIKGRYYPMMTFAPKIVAADRPYARNAKIWDDEKDLRRLYAGYQYRMWMKKQKAKQ